MEEGIKNQINAYIQSYIEHETKKLGFLEGRSVCQGSLTSEAKKLAKYIKDMELSSDELKSLNFEIQLKRESIKAHDQHPLVKLKHAVFKFFGWAPASLKEEKALAEVSMVLNNLALDTAYDEDIKSQKSQQVLQKQQEAEALRETLIKQKTPISKEQIKGAIMLHKEAQTLHKLVALAPFLNLAEDAKNQLRKYCKVTLLGELDFEVASLYLLGEESPNLFLRKPLRSEDIKVLIQEYRQKDNLDQLLTIVQSSNRIGALQIKREILTQNLLGEAVDTRFLRLKKHEGLHYILDVVEKGLSIHSQALDTLLERVDLMHSSDDTDLQTVIDRLKDMPVYFHGKRFIKYLCGDTPPEGLKSFHKKCKSYQQALEGVGPVEINREQVELLGKLIFKDLGLSDEQIKNLNLEEDFKALIHLKKDFFNKMRSGALIQRPTDLELTAILALASNDELKELKAWAQTLSISSLLADRIRYHLWLFGRL